MALADQAGVLAVQKLNDETLPQLKKDMAELLDSALIRVESMVARAEALMVRLDGAMIGFKLGPEQTATLPRSTNSYQDFQGTLKEEKETK